MLTGQPPGSTRTCVCVCVCAAVPSLRGLSPTLELISPGPLGKDSLQLGTPYKKGLGFPEQCPRDTIKCSFPPTLSLSKEHDLNECRPKSQKNHCGKEGERKILRGKVRR